MASGEPTHFLRKPTAVESERHFLLECSHFDQRRRSLYARINDLVQNGPAAIVRDPSKPAPLANFNMATESSDDQLLLLTGSLSRSFGARVTQQRVLTLILCEMHEWLKEPETRLTGRAALDSHSP